MPALISRNDYGTHPDALWPPNWRKVGIALLATGINTGVLAMLSMLAIGPRYPNINDPAVMMLELEHRPTVRGLPSQPSDVSQSRLTSSSSQTVGASSANRSDPLYEGRNTPVQPRITSAPSIDSAWQVQMPDQRGGQAGVSSRALPRGLMGCASPEQLPQREREACRARAAERMASAPQIQGTGNAARDAELARQGANRSARNEMIRRPLTGGVGVIGPADCPGSNLGHGCAGSHLPDVPSVDMRQGAKTTHNGGEQHRVFDPNN